MKKIIVSLLVLIVLSCSKSDDNNNCNFLLNVGVNTSLNLSLPQYQDLGFNLAPVYVPGHGNGGLIVMKTVSGYLAWDAADPNHAPTSCSVLQISGIEGTCGCQDANKYEFVSGQAVGNDALRCALRNYRAQLNGNNLVISN